jgi:hypothetical protein
MLNLINLKKNKKLILPNKTKENVLTYNDNPSSVKE